MATVLKSGALFLHVPKTGGNWVSDVLEAQGLVFAHLGGKHAGLPQLAPFFRLLETPGRYDRANRPLFTFCFVRHPLRWFESWYRMNVARGWPDWAADEEAWNPSVTLNGLRAGTFNGFIRNVLEQQPGFLTALYSYYTRDAHFVGRQEHAAEDLLAVLHFLKLSIDPGVIVAHRPVNVSAPVDVALDPSVLRALMAAEQGAFEGYGYADTAEPTWTLFNSCGGSIAVAGPFRRDDGCAWQLDVPELSRFADGTDRPRHSLLSLLEDGVPLPIAHAPHAEIRTAGRGRFSHWNGSVLFATSDSSNPNDNGRRYALSWSYPGPPDATHLLVQPAALPIGAHV